MLNEADILRALRLGEAELPPLKLELVGIEPQSSLGRPTGRPDAFVDVVWESKSYRFAAELKSRATPKAFRFAIQQIRDYAKASEMRPLFVTSYLAPERLEELESQEISGVDLCGNGVVVIPGVLLVFRTGNQNRFPADRTIRNVYSGASSLVARIFLLRQRFDSVQQVMDEIISRGGRISLATVSKALKTLEDDLMIRREGRASKVLQADELLDRLIATYEAPRVSARKKYRWEGSLAELEDCIGALRCKIVQTGAGSVESYGVMPREKAIHCYCTEIEQIERGLGSRLEESPRFPDLELVETREPTVYFDIRRLNSIPISSPIQAWLELQAGDKRQRDAARSVRARILDELKRGGGAIS